MDCCVWCLLCLLFSATIIFVWLSPHWDLLISFKLIHVVLWLYQDFYTISSTRVLLFARKMFQMLHLPLIYHQVHATCAHFKRIHTFCTHCTRIAVHMSYVGGPNEILLQCVAFLRMLSTKFGLFIWFFFSFRIIPPSLRFKWKWNIKLRQTLVACFDPQNCWW